MEEAGVLIGIAQLALILTGFISVFIVFTVSSDAKSRVHTHHAASMLMSSFLTAIGALTPLVFHY